MTAVSLIYAYWPNQPGGVTWCDLPWALRDKGLPKRLDAAGHEVIETMLLAEEPTPEELLAGLHLAAEIADAVAEANAKGELPVVLAGSCALAAIGAVGGLGDSTRIAWFDAHPDLNTPETSTSGLFEGMALAAATGNAWRAMVARHAKLASPANLEQAVLFGARDIDPAEQAVIDGLGLLITTEPAALAARISGKGPLYAHLDIDVHDAVGCNRFAAEGGPAPNVVSDALMRLDRIDCLAVTGLDPAVPDAAKAADIAIEHVLAVAAKAR